MDKEELKWLFRSVCLQQVWFDASTDLKVRKELSDLRSAIEVKTVSIHASQLSKCGLKHKRWSYWPKAKLARDEQLNADKGTFRMARPRLHGGQLSIGSELAVGPCNQLCKVKVIPVPSNVKLVQMCKVC